MGLAYQKAICLGWLITRINYCDLSIDQSTIDQNDHQQETLRNEISKLKADLDEYAGRGSKNSITDKMKMKILGSLTKNNLSMRQIEAELKDLGDNMEYFKKFSMPSTRPIQSVAYSVAALNLQQSIAFLESSKEIMLSFDGSTKSSKSIEAVVLFNEQGSYHCLESFVSTSGTAEVVANAIGQTFISVAIAAERAMLIDDHPTWSKSQLKKISMIISDSCPAAIRTKKLLSDIVRELADDNSMVIFEGDCAMHLISNAEKQLVKCLSQEASSVLKIVNEVLASDLVMVT